MEPLRILVADNSNIILEQYKNKFKPLLEQNGYEIELTLCNTLKEFEEKKLNKYTISFIDYWFFKDKIKEIKSKYICLTTSSEDINIPSMAIKKSYGFMYKPYNFDKIKKLINLFIYGSLL